MDTMQALVFKEVGKIVLEEVARPKIVKPDDAIVRVTSTTICGSDLHILHGGLRINKGKVVGHEFLGVVDEVGANVANFKPGERVLVKPFFKCESCDLCRAGSPICLNGGSFGLHSDIGGIEGGQAEYVRVPLADNALIRSPQDLTDDQLMFVTDILATGYFAALNGSIEPGDSVAVFGCGPVGICAQVCAGLFGPSQVFAVDMNADRLKVAESYGSIPIDASKVDAPEKIHALTPGLRGVDVAIEAVGLPATFKAALLSAQYDANISVVGIFSEPVKLPLQVLSSTSKRITMGLPLKMAEYIPRLIQLIRTREIDMTPLITHTMPLSEGEKAYEIFEKRLDRVMKIILKPGE